MLTSVGLQKVADAALNGGLGNLTLKLFKSNTTITAATVVGDLTEANFTGYSAITLTAATWADATLSGGVATAAYAEQEFAATASGDTVYGWYVITGAGVLIAAERFGSAITIIDGSIIRLTPKLPLSQPA